MLRDVPVEDPVSCMFTFKLNPPQDVIFYQARVVKETT